MNSYDEIVELDDEYILSSGAFSVENKEFGKSHPKEFQESSKKSETKGSKCDDVSPLVFSNPFTLKQPELINNQDSQFDISIYPKTKKQVQYFEEPECFHYDPNRNDIQSEYCLQDLQTNEILSLENEALKFSRETGHDRRDFNINNSNASNIIDRTSWKVDSYPQSLNNHFKKMQEGSNQIQKPSTSPVQNNSENQISKKSVFLKFEVDKNLKENNWKSFNQNTRHYVSPSTGLSNHKKSLSSSPNSVTRQYTFSFNKTFNVEPHKHVSKILARTTESKNNQMDKKIRSKFKPLMSSFVGSNKSCKKNDHFGNGSFFQNNRTVCRPEHSTFDNLINALKLERKK